MTARALLGVMVGRQLGVKYLQIQHSIRGVLGVKGRVMLRVMLWVRGKSETSHVYSLCTVCPVPYTLYHIPCPIP